MTDETRIVLVETESQGSLADIEVGDKVVVRGTRAKGSTQDAPAVDAKQVAVIPDGDRVLGRVTAVEGETLTLRAREGEVTVYTDADTSFWFVCAAAGAKQPATLADIARGTAILAFGEQQADGSLDADQVFIQHNQPDSPQKEPEDKQGRPQGGTEERPRTGQGSAPKPGARLSAQQS